MHLENACQNEGRQQHTHGLAQAARKIMAVEKALQLGGVCGHARFKAVSVCSIEASVPFCRTQGIRCSLTLSNDRSMIYSRRRKADMDNRLSLGGKVALVTGEAGDGKSVGEGKRG